METLDFSFVGSCAAASRLAFDKPVAVSLASGTGIAVPEFVVETQSTFRELGAPEVVHAVNEPLRIRLVLKPTRGGSALGGSVVRSEAETPPAMSR